MEKVDERSGGGTAVPRKARPRPGGRTRITLAAAVAVLLVSGAVAAYVRQGAEVVTVDAAVEAYRAQAASSAPTSQPEAVTVTSSPPAPQATAPAAAAEAGPPLRASATGRAAGTSTAHAEPPAPSQTAAAAEPQFAAPDGVYTYATVGHEETNALGGARHDYPSETAMTVRRAGCGGWVQRWQPLRERWDETELCPEPGGAVAVRRYSTYHEFFQRGQRQDFTCPEGTHIFRRDAAPGSTWQWRCTAGSSAIDTDVEVLGVERVDVGGAAVDAVHLRYSSVLTGGNRGRQEQHRWIDPKSGLNVKITTEVDTQAESPFGDVHYVEQYTVTLRSLTPRT